MNNKDESLLLHEKNKGKLEINSKVPINNSKDLSLAYTPGVAEPCKKIYNDPNNVYKYTSKGNLVAIVTDGSAVLGLGNIGPKASLPVMEGKAILFKEFAGIDAFPISIDTEDVEEIVNTIKLISSGFGGINLEDISAPRCIEIERRLKEELDIPVFHDDQHGTAIVVVAGLLNSLKIVNKDICDIKVVINGAGAAGGAIAKMLASIGVEDILICDSKGIISNKRENENWYKRELSSFTNKKEIQGSLEVAIKNADVFIGVSKGGLLTSRMVKSMNKDSIVFAMANPEPEIYPDIAKNAGARIVGTGRSDFPNQINNVLAFPGLFKGVLKSGAKEINNEMNIAAAKAIANIVKDEELKEEYIIPKAFNKEVVESVSEAVMKKAIELKIIR